MKQIFEPFGTVEYCTLQRDQTGRSQGIGFVQYALPVAQQGPTSPMPEDQMCSQEHWGRRQAVSCSRVLAPATMCTIPPGLSKSCKLRISLKQLRVTKRQWHRAPPSVLAC